MRVAAATLAWLGSRQPVHRRADQSGKIAPSHAAVARSANAYKRCQPDPTTGFKSLAIIELNIVPTRSDFMQRFTSCAQRLSLVMLVLGLVFATHAKATSTGKASNAPTAAECATPATQTVMNACADQDFLAATAAYAEQYRALSKQLPTAQRDRLQRMQTAWIAYRTASCRFESDPSLGGSAQGYVYWNCAARMTRERSAALASMASCREGDITCSAKKP